MLRIKQKSMMMVICNMYIIYIQGIHLQNYIILRYKSASYNCFNQSKFICLQRWLTSPTFQLLFLQIQIQNIKQNLNPFVHQKANVLKYPGVDVFYTQDLNYNTTDYNFKQKNQFPYAKIHLPAPGIIGNKQVTHNLSVFTGFDPLKEIVVGYLDATASINQDINQYDNHGTYKIGPLPQRIITSGAQTLQNQAKYFQSIGVKVVRVGVKDWTEVVNVGGLHTFGFNCFNARDMLFMFHDTIYQFPTHAICRSGEHRVFQWIQQQLKAKGAKVFSSWAPVPKQLNFRYQIKQLQYSYKSQQQYFGDAANLIKLGTDIVFLISISGSYGLYKKFRALMQEKYDGKVRVHPAHNLYEGVHVDTTICVVGFNKKLNKYLAFVQGTRVTPINIPAIFRGKNWILLDFTQFQSQYVDPQYTLASNSIGMNFLSINPELIIISDVQKTLKNYMEFYGITPVPMNNKYAIALGGGFYCSTNEIHREDVHGFGKILSTPTAQLTRQQRSGFFDPDLLQFLQSKGDIQNWLEICNQNSIFPTWTYDHLPQEQATALRQKHQKLISDYKNESKQ